MPSDNPIKPKYNILLIIGELSGLVTFFGLIYAFMHSNAITKDWPEILLIPLTITISLFLLAFFSVALGEISPRSKIYFENLYLNIRYFLFPKYIVDILRNIESKLEYLESNMVSRLESIDHQLNVLAASSSAAKAFSLNDISNIYVIYTHRWDDKPENCLENTKEIGKTSRYVVPSIPVDEAYLLFSLMHWILSTPTISEKGIKCSCNLVSHGNLQDEDTIKMNLAVVGINDVSRYLMKEMRTLGWNYYWYIDENESKIINKTTSVSHQSKRIADMAIGESAFCFGLISRTPNPFNRNSHLILVTGSRREGQQALTKWLTEPNNLMEMIPNNNDKYFQVLIKGEFEKKSDTEINIKKLTPQKETLTIK